MSTILERLETGARVVLIRLRSLGDCVLTTPALRLLKAWRPDLTIGVVVEDRFRAVFEGNPDVDEVLPPEFREVTRFRARLCLNLHGGTRSLMLTGASLAGKRAGFAHFRGAGLYNVRIPTAQEILGVNRKVHTAEHLASAVFYLGVPHSEIPSSRLYTNEPKSPAPSVVIHPAASKPEKTWPAARFHELACMLRKAGLEPIFIGAESEDLSAFQEFRVEQARPLEELKSLLAGASLMIGNDSGPAHMAAALNVPLVVLFGASDPVVWAPWKACAEQLVAAGGIESITVADVAEAAERVISRARVRA
jgi:ADP-heptose:LPS heptosyltransferase